MKDDKENDIEMNDGDSTESPAENKIASIAASSFSICLLLLVY